MKLVVKSKPNSKKEKIERIDEKNFLVAVKEAPVENKAIINILNCDKLSFQVLKPINLYIN